jgi:flagellar protein FlbD
MIKVTRLNGQEFVINAHQIESMEETPDTVITLLNGQKFVVKESVDEVIKSIIEYRRKIGAFLPSNE